MASPTQWTWVWVDSGSWWWTGRPGVLQFMGFQRVGHDWATDLNWYCVHIHEDVLIRMTHKIIEIITYDTKMDLKNCLLLINFSWRKVLEIILRSYTSLASRVQPLFFPSLSIRLKYFKNEHKTFFSSVLLPYQTSHKDQQIVLMNCLQNYSVFYISIAPSFCCNTLLLDYISSLA